MQRAEPALDFNEALGFVRFLVEFATGLASPLSSALKVKGCQG